MTPTLGGVMTKREKHEYFKEYKKKNPHLKDYKKEWYRKKKEQIKEYNKRYYEENKEILKIKKIYREEKQDENN